MTQQVMQTVADLRIGFLRYLFGEQKGFVCIATSNPDLQKTAFKQQFFGWPAQQEELSIFLEKNHDDKNVWFCVNLLSERKRAKETCLPCDYLWADLDAVDPDTCEPKPTAVIESSPGRYQGYWRLETDDGKTLPAQVCEQYSKRITYKSGGDKSGWDLGQLLRMPFTTNFKYAETPEVKIIRVSETRTPVGIFEAMADPSLQVLNELDEEIDSTVPESKDIPGIGEIVYKYGASLHGTAFSALYSVEPEGHQDWSGLMWRLLNVCFEVGMTQEEAFSIGLTAKCNKYIRDGRPPSYLWREVVKCEAIHKKAMTDHGVIRPLVMPILVDPESVFDELSTNFITEYKKWASEATDAIEEYHELSCFIMLSSVICSGLYLDASFGELAPNLWGLVLGDSTLSRKTTAMNMAKDILADIDPTILLATDGSAEGILTGLSGRPNRTSMFFKDEVSGFFDSINRKDYLAGMPELFTQLYDVPKLLTRLLRKDSITIAKPYFIFFGGGIKDKVHTLLSDEYVLSGFLPRFLIVSGEADLSKIRRTGPANKFGIASKQDIMDRVRYLHTRYTEVSEMVVVGQIVSTPKRYEAKLTEEAWQLYGDFEMKLVQTASVSPLAMLALPTFTRLAFSMLKMAMILAASSSDPDPTTDTITVEETHIRQAAYYVQKWGKYSIEMIEKTGISFGERALQKVLDTIKRLPGSTKSSIMQNQRLNSRDMNEIISTLSDRGLITVLREGRGARLYLTE